MPTCAYMLDVMVGDLCLTNPPAIVDRTKDPLCPIVALQVNNGPLLYIPFLSPESIQSHLHDIGNGHDFLPLEVEESYLNGGKFVFRRGRSCLFTAFQRSSGEAVKKDDDRTDVGQYISIIVVNGLHFPPAMFGRCKAILPSCGVENGEPKRNLTGKVILHDHSKKSVASLQVSISLRSLGEDIALHANHFDNASKEEKKIPGSVVAHNLKSDLTNDDSRKERLDKTINLLQEGEINKHLYSSHEYGKVNRQPYINEHYRPTTKTADSTYASQLIPKSSELLSMRIAEFERELQDKLLEVQNTNANSSQLDRNQQSPVLPTKKGSEMERLWNDKMAEVEGYALDFDESLSLSERTKSRSRSDSMEEKIEERHTEYKEVQLKKLKNKNKQKRNKKVLRDVAVSTHSPKKMAKQTNSSRRPTGWLRSTPLTPYRMHNVPPQPKLTRTSLLRRAKMDPELAKQLHAEVDFQVKLKLKVLDQAFKEEMSILHRKRLMRSARKKMAASSQTENEKDEDDLLLDIKPGSLYEDFCQQTDLFHQKSHKYTQMEGSFIKETYERAQGKYTEDKQRPQRPTTATKRRAGIRRGETYDIDVPDMGNTFTLGDPQQETFYASARVKKSEKVINSPKEHTDRQQSDYSQSISDSEPKQRRRGSHSTNRTRDSKIKPSGSTFTVVAQVGESQSDELSVEEKLVGSSSDKGSVTSRPVITESHSRMASSIQTITSVGGTDSEASEVSEASNLSIEVYQEILKGKKADLLMSNGSKSSRLQEALSESSAAEEILTAGDDSVGEESQKSNRKSNILQQMNKARGKGLINSRTYSIKEGQGLGASYNIPVIHGSSSSENDANVRGGITNNRCPSTGKGRDSVEGRSRGPSNNRLRSAKTTPSPRFHKSEDEVEEGTVSDISARIAALLLPKNVQVTSMHTDSISSYIPSDVEGTLSSLSDMS